jgi:hypothetical protein
MFIFIICLTVQCNKHFTCLEMYYRNVLREISNDPFFQGDLNKRAIVQTCVFKFVKEWSVLYLNVECFIM